MAKSAIDLSRLTTAEKFDLIDDLWTSPAPDDESTSSERDQRLDRLERTRLVGVSWDDVRAEMRIGRPLHT